MKYHGALRRYIQTKMDFLDISSLGVSYRYDVKIEQKFKQQKKWEIGSTNMKKIQSTIKTDLTNNLLTTSPSHRKRRVTKIQRRTQENGVISTKSHGITPMNVTQNSHWCPISNTRNRTVI
jgi:hypothetical protein